MISSTQRSMSITPKPCRFPFGFARHRCPAVRCLLSRISVGAGSARSRRPGRPGSTNTVFEIDDAPLDVAINELGFAPTSARR